MEENKTVVIYGTPFGKQRPKVSTFGGFARAYNPKKTTTYENLVKHEWCEQCNIYYEKDYYLKLVITAYFEIPKSFSKKKIEEAKEGKIRPNKKPDWDNIGKIISDALNKIAFADDSQIVEAKVYKYYAERPRVEFSLEDIKW